MSHEIHTLPYSDLEIESSFLVQGRNCGQAATVPIQGLLILGNPVGPILVDTGSRGPEIMAMLGTTETIPDGHGVLPQLAAHGLEPGDVAMVLHTHLHMDHAGKTDLFPMSVPVVVNRREVEVSCNGAGGVGYPIEDVKHILDRIHAVRAIRLLDLADSGPVHIAPGISCHLAGAHTDGSMNIHVETDEGLAVICGDVIYDVQNQIVDPYVQAHLGEPQITGNRTESTMREKAGIKKVLEQGDWVLPMHDKPARVEFGEVVGRVEGSVVPGPVVPVAESSAARQAAEARSDAVTA
jgi:glyoxylase-like metal-dependent hydrolase (beta-lactamase superfamily II)